MRVTTLGQAAVHRRYAFAHGGWRTIMGNLGRVGYQRVHVFDAATLPLLKFRALAGFPGDPWLPTAAFGRPAGLANARRHVRNVPRVYLLGFPEELP